MSFYHSPRKHINNGDPLSRSKSIPNMRNIAQSNENKNFNNTNNNTYFSNTNKLQSFLSQQEQNSSQINNNNITNDQSNNSATTTTTTTTTSANFYTITQYILQSYYKVDFNDLVDLKLIDLIVDQTYPDSLTLRKLNDSDTLQTYQYFNTISRDTDISRCPIFALSVYFVIRWSHPNPPITVDTFKQIKLLDPNHITYDSNPMSYIQNHLSGNVNSTTKIPRSTIFQPSDHLIDLVFPWLYNFKQDVLSNDRTNYTLHSLCELFEFMGRIIIQDLRYLNQHALLLPNIVTFMSKFIPDLLNDNEFKGFDVSNNGIIQSGSNNDNTSMLFNNTNSNVQLTSNSNTQLTNTNIPNDMMQVQTVDQSHNKLKNHMDNKFFELSKKLTTENIRLSQQVEQLKSDVSSLSSMCSQMIQLQKQTIANQNVALANNKETNENDSIDNNPLKGINNGILIIDKNSTNDESFKTLINALRGNNNKNSNTVNTGILLENRNQSVPSVNNNNNNNNLLSTLTPLIGDSNINHNNIQATSASLIQSIPSSKQSPVVSPQPIVNISPRPLPLGQSISHLSSGPRDKRKLPFPQNSRGSVGSIGSPFSDNSPGSISGIESPFPKRVRLDEKPTPSQTALDSLLFRSVSSSGAQSKMSPAAGLHPNLATNGLAKKQSTTFLVDGSFSSDSDIENPSDFPTNSGDDGPIMAIEPIGPTINEKVHTPVQTLIGDNVQQQKLHKIVSTSEQSKETPPIIADVNDADSTNDTTNLNITNEDAVAKDSTGKYDTVKSNNTTGANFNRTTNVGGTFQIMTGQNLTPSNATANKLQKIDESSSALGKFETQNKSNIAFASASLKPNFTTVVDKNKMMRTIKEFTVVQSNIGKESKIASAGNSAAKEKQIMKVKTKIKPQPKNSEIIPNKTENISSPLNKGNESLDTPPNKKLTNQLKSGPNENIKYKLSRDNKTIWDLYAEWYIGINGKPSIEKLIDEYGWRRWKVTEDSHFFPTRKIIIQYIDTECDRGLKFGRFSNDQSRDEIRKIIVSDMEKFRINNGLTLNSLSLYFRNLTKKNKEICIFKDFSTWQTKKMTHVEKTKYSKRKHTAAEVGKDVERSTSAGNITNPHITNASSIPVISFKQHRIYNIQPVTASGLRSSPSSISTSKVATPNLSVQQQSLQEQSHPPSLPEISKQKNSGFISDTTSPKNDNKSFTNEAAPSKSELGPTKDVNVDIEDMKKKPDEPAKDE